MTEWTPCIEFCIIKGELHQLWSRMNGNKVERVWRKPQVFKSIKEANAAKATSK